MSRTSFKLHNPNNHLEGSAHYRWKGGMCSQDGYLMQVQKDHPNCNRDGYVKIHVLVAESILGRYLKKENRVHHVDGNKLNNHPTNLIICENELYHQLLHQRRNALESCGKADFRKCRYCGRYAHPSVMYAPPRGMSYHRECRRQLRRAGVIK